MNSFIQEYGRIIVITIIILCFIAFSVVYGDAITTGVKDSLTTFENSATTEFSLHYKNNKVTDDGDVSVTVNKKALLLEYNENNPTSKDAFYYDWDYDANWYKISDNTYLDSSIYCEWTVADDAYWLKGLAGQSFKGVAAQHNNGKYTTWILPGMDIGLIVSIEEEYTDTSGGRNKLMTPGLYICDVCAIAFEESASLKIWECSTELSDDLSTVEIDGTTLVKISNKTFTKEDIVGKTLTATAIVSGSKMTENITFSNSNVSVSGNLVIAANLLASITDGPNKGIYVPVYLLDGSEGAILAEAVIE